jgi:hypothetical protein
LQRLWRGYAAVVGLIIIVAVSTGDRGSSAIAGGIVTWPVVSTRGGGADSSGTDSGSADADRNSRAYTTVNATAIDTTAIDTAAVDTTAICGGVS